MLEGDTAFFDADRAAADVQKIVEAGGDGHGRATTIRTTTSSTWSPRLAAGSSTRTASWACRAASPRARAAPISAGSGCIAHEYFHNWNIKRLRPIELGPFDYENEVHTKALWIAEGFTDYYAGLLVKRAGLSTRDEYLEELSGQIEAVQNTPGPARDIGRHGVVRHVDQAVPARREHARTRRSTTTRRGR